MRSSDLFNDLQPVRCRNGDCPVDRVAGQVKYILFAGQTVIDAEGTCVRESFAESRARWTLAEASARH